MTDFVATIDTAITAVQVAIAEAGLVAIPDSTCGPAHRDAGIAGGA